MSQAVQTEAIHKNKNKAVEDFMAKMLVKHSHEPEFLQAVEEVAEAVIPFIADKPQ